METLKFANIFPTSLAPFVLNYVTTSILVAAVVTILTLSRKRSQIPHANPTPWFYPTTINQLDAVKNAIKIPFRMINYNGEMLVLPARYLDAIRNDENLSFSKAIELDFHSHVPGFTPQGLIGHQGNVLQNLARRPLTKLLNTITKPLASESLFAVKVVLGNPTGNPTDWQETFIFDSMLSIIARLSSRVFLGERLCRDEDWLKVTKLYTVEMFHASFQLTLVPPSLRFLFAIFSKRCRTAYQHLQHAQKLITPIIQERRLLKEQASREGKPIPKFNDAIEWGEVECNGISYDPADLQLGLSFAAIHTTSDLLSKILLLLAREPKLIDPLQEEIIRVLNQDGWSKNSLFNMKLLDSTMKEAQRMLPNEKLAMRRIATKDIYILEENFTIRKGQYIMIDDNHGADLPLNDCYSLDKFDIYRWLRLRETPEFANKAHFVSTSPEHLGFGHGLHSCPGRFFAANETKIALIFLLLEYDWELPPGATIEPTSFGNQFTVNPKSIVRYRKRKAEVNLEALEFD
ncbi:cytochrome P450 [Bipolaris maydis]|nr:cytochrome P450 [Bipolaris maydis]